MLPGVLLCRWVLLVWHHLLWVHVVVVLVLLLRVHLVVMVLLMLVLGHPRLLGLLVLGVLREVLGTGSLFANMGLLLPFAADWEVQLFETTTPFLLAILPPGARGQVDTGLGPKLSSGTIGYMEPTETVSTTDGTLS